MAKKSIISASVENNVLSFIVDGAGSITIDLAELPSEIRDRAMIHGLTQKVSDAAAIAKAELPESEVEAAKVKFSAMQAVAQRLIDGDWSKRSGDGVGPVAGVIFRAFAEFVANAAKAKKRPAPSEAEIRAVYDAKDRAGQLALRNVPEIAAIIDRIKSERGATAAKAVDTESLLGELGL